MRILPFSSKNKIKTSHPKLCKFLKIIREVYRTPKKFKNFSLGNLNIRFKKQICKICGSTNSQIIHVDWARYILRCSECDIQFAGKINSGYTMAKGYDNKKYWAIRRLEILGSKGNGDVWKDWQNWKRQTFERLKLGDFERTLGSERKVLEIGCGEGKVLEILKERGWEVLGLDVSEYKFKTCQESGLKVIAGSIEETAFPDSFFDLVVMFHLLEHLIDPILVLKKIFKILKNSGRLIIEVPFLSEKQDFLLDYKELGHFFFFTEKGLQKVLNMAGFTYLDQLIYDDLLNQPRRNVCYMFEKKLGSVLDF